LLAVEIEDYEELLCPKTIHCIFDVNKTVQEAMNKLAKKGNLFIDDISEFKLIKPPDKKMDKNKFVLIQYHYSQYTGPCQNMDLKNR
jgi:hypothetical protein